MNTLAVGFVVAFTVAMSARAGLAAAAGRTGLVDTSASDARGAWQGAAVGVALVISLWAFAVGAVAANLVPVHAFFDAARTLGAVYAPYGLALAVAVISARVRSWRVRSWANALGVGGLDFVWPGVAIVAVGLVIATGADAVASGICGGAVAVTLVVRPLVEKLWYRSAS